MLDFMMISTRNTKKGIAEIYPRFIVKKSSDLMIRGGDFYAIWLNDKGVWSTNEYDAMQAIDNELDIFYKENKDRFELPARILHLWDAETGMVDQWHKYCQKQQPDSYHVLDETLIFSNTPTKKEDYSSKRLNYPLEPGPTDSYDRLMSVLYSEEERHKIEWAIGSVVTGDSKKIQKFLVFYGAAGTGKSTVLNIIQQLFDGYYSVFDARALGSSSNSFALEAFKSNPLVAIQHDGDLSHIEDNTRLNSLVSHELMTVNEKFKSTYANKFNSMLFMGTNRPVQMTDTKTGLKRRLIDVQPTGNLVPVKRYNELIEKIKFELPGIAWHCLELYKSMGPNFYNGYEPVDMFYKTNMMFNFVEDSYFIFKEQDYTTLKQAYDMYKAYIRDNAESYKPMTKMAFRDELDAFFKEHKEEGYINNVHVRHLYTGFKKNIFNRDEQKKQKPVVSNLSIDIKKDKKKDWLEMTKWSVGSPNILNDFLKECKAQYSTANGIHNVQNQIKSVGLFEGALC